MPTSLLPTSRAAGFTLIELLVVLTLLGLLAGILATRIDRAPSGLTRAQTVGQLELALKAARATARRTGRPTSVRPSEVVRGVALMDPAFIGPVPGAVTFYGDGSATGGSLVSGEHLLLTIDWLTGEAGRAGK